MITHLLLWRKEAGLSQREAARRLDIPTLTYRLIENRGLKPSPREWDALRREFGAEAERMVEPVAAWPLK